jgi:hypothetical protein
MRRIFKTGIKRLSRTLIAALIVTIALSSQNPLLAQTATGSIVGVVRDSTGGVVVGAQITLLNVDQNQTARTVTNNLGYYSFPLLQPVHYNLTIEAPGFKQFIQQNIKLDVDESLNINANLQVGQVSQSVTVSAEPPPLETQTSSLGQVIETKSMVDLPLDGRNSYGLAGLIPGVIAPYGFTQTAWDMYSDQFISINGSRPNQSIFLLDGGVNSETAFNGPAYFPSVDLVQEYKVQTSNFSAEYSNTGGGVVNVVTKSGTNELHGAAWEFFRNTDLEGNSFFSNQAGLPRSPFSFNQFGVALGGPIKKNKTFFFFAYEGEQWTQSGTTTLTVPTAAQRSGDFSSTYNSQGQVIPIYNPFTTMPDPANPGQTIRTQYPGNKIPAADINPVASAILKYIPLPNQPGNPLTGANNYIVNYSYPTPQNNFSLRIDQAITDRQKLYGRYSINDTTISFPNTYQSLAPSFQVGNPEQLDYRLREQQATIDYTNALSPNKVLELNSSFVRYFIGNHGPALGVNPTVVGLPDYFNALAAQYTPCFPSTIISGEGQLTGQSCDFLRDAYQDIHEYGNLTWVHRGHAFKMGGNFGFGLLSTARYTAAGPSFSFGPNFTQGPNPEVANGTGIGAASFLAGTGTGDTGSGGPDQILNYRYYGGYFQDDWRVTPRLTLNLGIRYDYNAPWAERFNRVTDWTSTAQSPLQVAGLPNLVGGLEFPGVNGLSHQQFNPFRAAVAPRTGFGFAASKNTAVRGGFGIFFAPITGAGFNGNAVPNSGFLATTTWISTLDGVTPLNTLSNPFPQEFVYPTNSSQGLATQLGQTVVAMDRNRPISYAEDWNLDIQQTLPAKMVFDLAYAGSHGVHLYADFVPDQLPDRYLGLGSQLNAQVANPFYQKITTGGLSSPTVASSQLLRPFPQFTAVTLGDSSFFGGSSYNAMQLKLEKRYSNGATLLVAYTWSKLMDNIPASVTGFAGGLGVGAGAIQDWDNLPGERALATFDTPQYLTINGTYELPFGRKGAFFNQSKTADYFIGGWQLNGIFTLASGNPQEVTTASNTLFNYGGTQRANWNGENPSLSGKVSKRLNEYFNVSDFSNPAPFTYGNSSRSLAQLLSPGRVNTDFSGFKTFPIHEAWRAEFRAEAFNLFNHPYFNAPDTSLGDGTTGVISGQTNLPRQIQLAVKFLW